MLEKASCCKVNLLLNILGKRADGFHELETVMHPVPFHDRLDFERAGAGVQLSCNDPRLPVGPKNLVAQAARLFAQAAGLGANDGVRIHLQKNIPIAAGLGGGSGNAAVTLLAMNELFGQPLPQAKLQELAASLGSDIPFFLQNGPALATGRGEIIEPLAVFPAMRGIYFVLVHPGFGISTPWAYQQLAKFPAAINGTPGRARRLIGSLQASVKEAAGEFYNSLEAPALRKHPLLELFQEFFRDNGALASLMSGSGSATFALAPSRPSAETMLEKFNVKFGSACWTAIVPAA
ncbi:MAG TPA: 4-(cytidine 5'-diphospho)-2-C-methyl-D-erythritol kinase [Verrucomicrobiae bacterium]